jgi:hypothetical protein
LGDERRVQTAPFCSATHSGFKAARLTCLIPVLAGLQKSTVWIE